MKQKKSSGKMKRGPFLAAAFFCERTIQEKEDNSLSVVRMFDTVTLQLDPSAPPDVPSKEKRLAVAASGLIAFKSGESPGDATLKLIVESPSGKKKTMLEQQIALSSEPNGGFNFRMSLTFAISSGGLYLIHVYLDNKRYTSMPLNVSVDRSLTTGPSVTVQPASFT